MPENRYCYRCDEIHTSGRDHCDRCEAPCSVCNRLYLTHRMDSYRRCRACRTHCGVCASVTAPEGQCQVCGIPCPTCKHLPIEIEGCSDCPVAFQSKVNVWNYRPDTWFFREEGPEKRPRHGPLYIGTEVEMELGKVGRDETAQAIKLRSKGPWYMKTDGSLADGLEVVSHPVDIERWRTKVDLDWFKRARKVGCRSYDTTTCGLHFHIARRHFTKLHLWKILHLLAKHRQWFVGVSQREPQHMTKYLKPDDLEDRIDRRKLVHKAVCAHGGTRYEAINVTNRATIEFRFFRGTLAPGGFIRNMDWLACLVAFTRTASRSQLTPKAFHRWLVLPDSVPYISRESADQLSKWSEEKTTCV